MELTVPGVSVQVLDKSLYEIAKALTTNARDKTIRVQLAKLIKYSDTWGVWKVLIPEYDGLDDNTLKVMLAGGISPTVAAIHLMNCSVNLEHSAAFADEIRPDADKYNKSWAPSDGGNALDKLRWAMASRLKKLDPNGGVTILTAFAENAEMETLYHKFFVWNRTAIARFCEARSVWITKRNFRYSVYAGSVIRVTHPSWSDKFYSWDSDEGSKGLRKDLMKYGGDLSIQEKLQVIKDIEGHCSFTFALDQELKDILFAYACVGEGNKSGEKGTVEDTFITQYIRNNVHRVDDFPKFMAEVREKMGKFKTVINRAWGTAKEVIEASGDLIFTKKEIKMYRLQRRRDTEAWNDIIKRASKTWRAREIFKEAFDEPNITPMENNPELFSDRDSAGLYQAFLGRKSPRTSELISYMLKMVQEGRLLYKNVEDQGADEVWLRRLLHLASRKNRESIADLTKTELLDTPDCYIFREPVSQTITILYKSTTLYDREGYVESAQNVYSDHHSLSELLAAVLSTAIKVNPIEKGEVQFERALLEHFVSQSRFGAYSILYNADVHVKDRLVRESEIWKCNPPSWAKLRSATEKLLSRMGDVDKNWVIREVFSRLVLNGVAIVDPLSDHRLSCFALSLKENFGKGELHMKMDTTVPLQGVKAVTDSTGRQVAIRLKKAVKIKAETQGITDLWYLNMVYLDRHRVHLMPGSGKTPRLEKKHVIGDVEAGDSHKRCEKPFALE